MSGTGLRIGFLVAPERIVEFLIKLQGNTSGTVCLPMMRGYASFLQIDRDMHLRKGIVERLKQKREIMLNALQSHEGFKHLKWNPPQG